MTRVRHGLTIDEVRQIWLSRSEGKTRTILNSYHARRESSGGGYGHEGLGIYGMYQERAAREKVRLAAKLLEKAGLEVSYKTIRSVTGQSSSTICRYWVPPKQNSPENPTLQVDEELPQVIQFPREKV
ncbi:MAG: hypothetical protein V1790_10270 [Planctomycetota bacterium]